MDNTAMTAEQIWTMGSGDYLAAVDSRQLIGTEKQVSWASRLRHDMVAAARSEVTYVISRDGAATQSQKDTLLLALDALASHSEAKFWIDNRSGSPRRLVYNEIKPL